MRRAYGKSLAQIVEQLARHLTGWRAQVRQAVDFQFPHAHQRRAQVLGDALSEVVFVAQGVGRRNPTNDKRAAVANGRGAGIAARPYRSTWKRPSNQREISHMAHVTGPLPGSDGLWLDLVFQMDKLNGAMRQFDTMTDGNRASDVGQNPPSRSAGAFGPEVIAAMCEALEAACKELGDDITQPEVAREVLARRIIAAARLGERDPVRLQAAALRKPD